MNDTHHPDVPYPPATWRIIEVPHLLGGHWYSYRVENAEGGSMDFGFEPTVEELERKWSFERDVFVEEWSKPPTDEDRERWKRKEEYRRMCQERRRKRETT